MHEKRWSKLYAKTFSNQFLAKDHLCFILFAYFITHADRETGTLRYDSRMVGNLLGVSHTTIQRAAKRLEDVGIILSETHHSGSEISICKWGVYQSTTHHRRTTDAPPLPVKRPTRIKNKEYINNITKLSNLIPGYSSLIDKLSMPGER